MSQMIEKYGPWAVISGASSGLGEEFAKQLAALGFNLILIARRRELLESLAAHLTASCGVQVRVVVADLSTLEWVEQVRELARELPVGLLINNAGVALTGDFLAHSLDKEIGLLHLNTRAPLILTQIFGKFMAERGQGGIINVSSASAFLPMPSWSNYAATKAYLLHFSEGLSYEFKKSGVDVLALCPGATRTGFSEAAGTKASGMEPAPVVALALRSLGKNSSIVPGFGNRMAIFLNRLIPRSWQIIIGAKAVSGMSAKTK